MNLKKVFLLAGLGITSMNLANAQQQSCDITGSLIPNHNFNDYTNLPTSFSQMYNAVDWFQVTSGTSDYFHENSYLGGTGGLPTIATSPDGGGFAGFYSQVTRDYYEYVGNRLNTPLIAGESYTFILEVAGGENYNNTSGIPYTMDLTFYGIETDPGNRPLFGGSNIITTRAGIETIASTPISIDTSGNWQEVSVTFTPSKNYEVLILGGENTIHTGINTPNLAYTVVDNLRVDKTACINPPTALNTKVQKIPSTNWLGFVLLISSLLGIAAYRQFRLKK